MQKCLLAVSLLGLYLILSKAYGNTTKDLPTIDPAKGTGNLRTYNESHAGLSTANNTDSLRRDNESHARLSTANNTGSLRRDNESHASLSTANNTGSLRRDNESHARLSTANNTGSLRTYNESHARLSTANNTGSLRTYNESHARLSTANRTGSLRTDTERPDTSSSKSYETLIITASKNGSYPQDRLGRKYCPELDHGNLGRYKLKECGWWIDINGGVPHVLKVFQNGENIRLACYPQDLDEERLWKYRLIPSFNITDYPSIKPNWIFKDFSTPRRKLTLPRKYSILIDERILQNSTHFSVECRSRYNADRVETYPFTRYDFQKNVTDPKTWKSVVSMRLEPNGIIKVKEGKPLKTCVVLTYRGEYGWGLLRGTPSVTAWGLPQKKFQILWPLKANKQKTQRTYCSAMERATLSMDNGWYKWSFHPHQNPGAGQVIKIVDISVKSIAELQIAMVREKRKVPFYNTVEFIVAVASVTGLFFISGIIVCICVIKRKPKYMIEFQTVFINGSEENDEDNAHSVEAVVNINGRPPSERYISEGNYILPKDVWELDRKAIKLGPVIGEGQFGKVYHANYTNGRQVAVKTLKNDAIEKDLADLLSELSVLEILGEKPHPNIIQLVGCLTEGRPVAVVTEFAAYGNLLQFMRRHWSVNSMAVIPCTAPVMFEMAEQIAAGMEYLSSRKIIHRDLAARNVLVTSDCVLQLSDFGLTRKISDKDYYAMSSRTPVPVKWMPPESLATCKFTLKSDVWSYGVTVWEVYTSGGVPYNINDPFMLMDFLNRGGRLSKPKMMPDEMYSLLGATWADAPSQRPNFSQIAGYLAKMKNTLFGDAGYIEMTDSTTPWDDVN